MSALAADPRAQSRTPNFFLVGAPKAGTTSLYSYLDQHPQIFMSPLKEPHYLADEIRLSNFSDESRRRAEPRLADLRAYLNGPMTTKFSAGFITQVSDYLRLFQNATTEDVLGEASVCYLWSPTAPGNIARACPQAKILMLLRNPVDRAYSQYLQVLASSRKPQSFREYVEAAMNSHSTLMGPLYPFLHFGRYCEQVKRYLKQFPRQQVQICFYEDYQSDAAGMLRDIFQFLGVDHSFAPDISQRYMQVSIPRSHRFYRLVRPVTQWAPVKQMNTPVLRRSLKRLAFRSRKSLAMDPPDRAFLVDFYREDILNLSQLLNRDLNAWLATE